MVGTDRSNTKNERIGVGLASRISSNSSLSRDIDTLQDDPFFYEKMKERRKSQEGSIENDSRARSLNRDKSGVKGNTKAKQYEHKSRGSPHRSIS